MVTFRVTAHIVAGAVDGVAETGDTAEAAGVDTADIITVTAGAVDITTTATIHFIHTTGTTITTNRIIPTTTQATRIITTAVSKLSSMR